LLGLFAAGLAPKGSNDPFALRRAAIQIIENLVANEQPFDLREALRAAAPLLPVASNQDNIDQVLAFIDGRLGVVLREQGNSSYVVKAVLAELGHDPFQAAVTAADLSRATEADGWPNLLNAFARCVRITRKLEDQFPLNPAQFTLDAEQELFAAYEIAAATSDGTVPSLVNALQEMVPAISRFFEDVMVMAEDLTVRENRLALLQHIANLTKGIADLSLLEGF
jgi:glycyl-tRNA synthetase